MWIATKVGFLDCEKRRKNTMSGTPASDLVELVDLTGIESEIFESEYADYRFRIVVDSDTVRKLEPCSSRRLITTTSKTPFMILLPSGKMRSLP